MNETEDKIIHLNEMQFKLIKNYNKEVMYLRLFLRSIFLIMLSIISLLLIEDKQLIYTFMTIFGIVFSFSLTKYYDTYLETSNLVFGINKKEMDYLIENKIIPKKRIDKSGYYKYHVYFGF
jgi:hypothetical protein